MSLSRRHISNPCPYELWLVSSRLLATGNVCLSLAFSASSTSWFPIHRHGFSRISVSCPSVLSLVCQAGAVVVHPGPRRTDCAAGPSALFIREIFGCRSGALGSLDDPAGAAAQWRRLLKLRLRQRTRISDDRAREVGCRDQALRHHWGAHGRAAGRSRIMTLSTPDYPTEARTLCGRVGPLLRSKAAYEHWRSLDKIKRSLCLSLLPHIRLI